MSNKKIKSTSLSANIENAFHAFRSTTAGEFSCEFHCHDNWEIYIYLDGDVTYYVEDKVYNMSLGDVIVIPPGKMHQSVVNNCEGKTYERIVLNLNPSYINKLTENDETLKTRYKSFIHQYNFLLNYGDDDFLFIKGLAMQIIQKGQEDAFKLTMLNSFIYSLGSKFEHPSYNRNAHEDKLISAVIQYINQHYVEQLSLDKICDEFFVSKFYLNRRFKEYTKLTIYDYILSKRIALARRLIRSGVTANETAEKCGFGDYSTFYRAFISKTNQTPKEFKNSF